MLGIWLIVSPFIFAPAGGPWSWNSLLCGAAVVILSLASFWRPLAWAHYITGVVAAWLAGHGYFAFARPGGSPE